MRRGVVIVLLALAAIAWLATATRVSVREEAASRGSPTVVGPAAGERASPRRRTPSPLARQVRRFLAAFFRYEVGEPVARWEAELRDTASAALADQLARRPPRVPHGVPRAQVRRLTVGSVRRGRAAAAVWIARAGHASTLSVFLDRRDNRWRVVELRR